MKRIQEEAEVIIRLDYETDEAHICVAAWPAMASKMDKLYGPGKDGEQNHSRRWVVPIKAISFRKIGSRKAKAPMSAEHKAKLFQARRPKQELVAA
jgi:hypothetical protein